MKVALHNLGCKVNAYETEAMKQQLEINGYEIVDFHEMADIYIINTCTVTNIADRKSRQMLHKAKKMNPDSIVVAVGCYVQASKEELENDSAVDLMIGNNRKKELAQILNDYMSDRENDEAVIDINAAKEYEELKINSQAEHTRVNIKIQDGCNQFCSYCIIPYARGRVRSRAANDIVKEVESLADKGYKEIVLTGIHLSSYGIDFKDGINLLTLIKMINDIKGVERIRLGSLEPRIITEDFVTELKQADKVCPHFHLSLQSGCDTTLKRMNRFYSVSEYYDKCCLLRKSYDNPSITTDVIVGFPGETEEEFEETYEFLKKARFASMHVFKYSARKGTKAAEFENQVGDSLKAVRSDTLLKLAGDMTKKYLNSFISKKVLILIEDETIINNQKYQLGYTEEYVKVAIPNFNDLHNKIVNVKVSDYLADEILLAEFINIV